jgi:hypothetical protein
MIDIKLVKELHEWATELINCWNSKEIREWYWIIETIEKLWLNKNIFYSQTEIIWMIIELFKYYNIFEWKIYQKDFEDWKWEYWKWPDLYFKERLEYFICRMILKWNKKK